MLLLSAWELGVGRIEQTLCGFDADLTKEKASELQSWPDIGFLTSESSEVLDTLATGMATSPVWETCVWFAQCPSLEPGSSSFTVSCLLTLETLN